MPASSCLRLRVHVLLTGLLVALLFSACRDKGPSAPPPAPPPPKPDPAQQMAEARARVAAEREKLREEMRAVGEGTVTKMKRAGDKLEFIFEFTNKGDKPLSQAEGAIAFYDASDTLLKQIKVPFREPIAPGKSVEKRGRFPIDKSKDGDVALAKSKLGDMTLKWMPRLYRFDDGATMESD